MIKGRKVRVYNANIIIFNKSTIRFTIANLSLDLSPDDLTLIKESNGQLMNINNSPSTSNIERGLLSLVEANNTKNININIE